MFPNNTKKGNSNRALPFAFKDIVIDNDGFVYTATDGAKKAQIKKLSPGLGNNILHSSSTFELCSYVCTILTIMENRVI